ncbi:hypothetical protein GW17_00003619 [Ensete ventricosum]|nr:hypothetical protein GW17_00003619 [Ensete ventricosum]RZS19693.1 hypothetical protein BHM03_00052133 [Ensete ventricosum]
MDLIERGQWDPIPFRTVSPCGSQCDEDHALVAGHVYGGQCSDADFGGLRRSASDDEHGGRRSRAFCIPNLLSYSQEGTGSGRGRVSSAAGAHVLPLELYLVLHFPVLIIVIVGLLVFVRVVAVSFI